MARFQLGNTAAVRSGYRSARLRESWRKERLSEMRALIDKGLGEPHPADLIARDLLACALADIAQLDAFIDAHGGPLTAKGGLLKACDYRRARERDAVVLMDRLGMAPKARSQILGNAVATEGLASQLARRRLEMTNPKEKP